MGRVASVVLWGAQGGVRERVTSVWLWLWLFCAQGLYRGLTLNYIKTVPNVAIYMSLYDVVRLGLAFRV